MMPSHKLVIIGIDAADFRFARELIDRGEMPSLAAVRERGNFSCLKSVIPPNTAPGWTSITTGVNPGIHGIYYFYNFSSFPLRIANSTDTSTPRIWDFVQALGQRSVIVNVPFTYPVRAISGSVVAGIPPWFLDERSVYPKDLLSRLRDASYEVDTPMSRALEKQPDALVDRLLATERRRVDVFLDLLKKDEWSFAMIVLTALDRLQHKLLGKGEEELVAVRRGYREIDRLVGKIIEFTAGEANTLITSDHGFNATPVGFYPNAWLHQQGLLKRRSRVPREISRMLHNLFDGHLLWMPQSVTKRYQGANVVAHSIDAVDLDRSRAFVPGTDGVIVVRSSEDERKIIDGLSGLRDDSGKPVCTVHTREEVYKGERLGSAPPLLIVPRDDVNIKTDPFARSVVSRGRDFSMSNHGANGIFFATGPGIKKTGSLEELRLEDVAPTSLALLGVRPPVSMDGRIIEEIIAEPRVSETLRAADASAEDRTYRFSEEDETQVMDNLKRLGYM